MPRKALCRASLSALAPGYLDAQGGRAGSCCALPAVYATRALCKPLVLKKEKHFPVPLSSLSPLPLSLRSPFLCFSPRHPPASLSLLPIALLLSFLSLDFSLLFPILAAFSLFLPSSLFRLPPLPYTRALHL